MCGRYTLTSAPEVLRALFGYEEYPDFPARYNIAPTQPIPIVRLVDGKRRFALVRWGLVPSWVKDPNDFSLLVNARGESVRDKPAFRAAMKYRRCLIPADGFYEWQARGRGPKQPFHVRARSGAPLAFAGLWENWMGPNGEEIETALIVTTKANATLGPIHERMPVIVPPDAYNLWLDTMHVDEDMAAAVIAPAPDDVLEVRPVSTAVNRTANDNPTMLDLFEPREEAAPKPTSRRAPRAKRENEDGGQGALF